MSPKPRPQPRPYRPRGVPFSTRLVDANGSFSLAVDGSVNPVEFDFEPDDDLAVTELSLIFEADGPVVFGDNFAQLKALVKGIEIELQTQGVDVKARFGTTRDLLEYSVPGGFYVSDVDGSDAGGKSIVKATRKFTRPLMLMERRGDHIKLVVKDDLTGFSYAIASVLGYTI